MQRHFYALGACFLPAAVMQRSISYGINEVINCYLSELEEKGTYESALKALGSKNYFEAVQEEAEEAAESAAEESAEEEPKDGSEA